MTTTVPGENPGFLFNLTGVGAGVGRTMADHGFYLHGASQIATFGAVSGGANNGARTVNLGYWGADIDTEKMFGLPGGLFDFTFTTQAGNTSDAINSIGTAYVPFGFGDQTRLINFNYTQSFLNHALQIQFGRMQAGYSTTPYLSPGFHKSSWYCLFFTTSCGTPTAFNNNSAKAPYEIGSWGAAVTVHPAPNWYVKGGVFENQPSLVTSREHNGWPGEDWNFNEAQGAYIPFQIGYVTTPAQSLYPTEFHIGGYYDTAEFPDKFFNSRGLPTAFFPGAPRLDEGQSGMFFGLMQTVYRPNPDPKSRRGLALFITGDWDFGTENTVQAQYSGGFTYIGPFASRPLDRLNFLVSASMFESGLMANRNAVAAAHHVNYNMSHWEVGYEVNYGFAVAPGMTVSPFVQYVDHPSQIGLAVPDPDLNYSLTVGVRAMVSVDTLLGLPHPGH